MPMEEKRNGRNFGTLRNKQKSRFLSATSKVPTSPPILHYKTIGSFLTVRGTIVSSTILSATEFQDFLCARYKISLLNLQKHCDGCGTAFGATHTLICSIEDLVIAHYKEIRDELLYLSWRAFTSESVRAELLIHQVRTRFKQDIRQGSDRDKETRGCVVPTFMGFSG